MITVVLGVLLAVLLALTFLYRLFMLLTEEDWQPSALWILLAQEMHGIFGTVVTLAVLLACKEQTFLRGMG